MNILISSTSSSIFCLIFLLIAVNARIICPRNNNNASGGGSGEQQRSLCRQRFVELKNTPAYRSMLQAIADRRLPLAGSIASFQQPPPSAIVQSPLSSLLSPASPRQLQQQQQQQQSFDEDINNGINRPLTTYQDIMHNLLMKMP